jgi:hypothetical protein
MSNSAYTFEQPLDESTVPGNDPRRELVNRIVASQTFVKSQRLCSFLRFVSEMSLEGRDGEISELSIGEAVFGRSPDYDPSIDSIVRSHASRLRQRLEKYFLEEGMDEIMRLSIPRGGYIPVFEPVQVAPLDASTPELFKIAQKTCSAETDTPVRTNRFLIWTLSIALALACGCIVNLLGHREAAVGDEPLRPVPAKIPFWGAFLDLDHPATVICSDIGLTILENLTHTEVKLTDYMSGDYRAHPRAPVGATPKVAKELAEHRYTSIVDLQIVSKLNQIAEQTGSRLQVRYARDIRIDELKNGSAILLGTQEGNPWVGLFTDRMNFVIEHNRAWGDFSVVNRSPRGNESAHYDTSKQDPSHTVYGVAALLPNVGGAGKVLILEGTSMAGTESAADFVFDHSRLTQFLSRIQGPDGAIPYFEVLLQSSNVDGNASQSRILGFRTFRD